MTLVPTEPNAAMADAMARVIEEFLWREFGLSAERHELVALMREAWRAALDKVPPR
jgi:hypothetical protein